MSEGAILTMPEGATSQDLNNIEIFRKYATMNVHKWYKYVNGILGCNAKNGDIRLVVGFDKATSWGMAALPNTDQQSELKFKARDRQSSGMHSKSRLLATFGRLVSRAKGESSSHSYIWECSGMADTQVGPVQGEIEELRRKAPHDLATQSGYLNQSLFVRTLNITMNDNDWDKLQCEIGIGCVFDSATGHGTGTLSPSPHNQDSSSNNTQSMSPGNSNFGIVQRAGDSSALEFSSLDPSANCFSAPPIATVSGLLKRG